MNTPDPSDTEFERIARHLAGETVPAEREAFERWLSDPASRALFEAASADWRAAGPRRDVDVESAWFRLQARLGSHVIAEKQVQFQTRAVWWRHNATLLRVAAAVVVVAGAAFWLTRNPAGTPGVTRTASVNLEERTGVAETRLIGLPDGSSVRLAATSSLTTRDGYGAGSREVELVGEAFFSVTHDENRPFRVHTAGALIEDLGTEFVVRAIAREPVRVAVSEGSVAVRATGAPASSQVVLEPRDVAIVSDTGDVVVSRGVDVAPYVAWNSGQLVFRNTPLREAIADLERWYDVDFDVNDAALLARPIDVTFEGQSIEQVLQVIGTALSVKFERTGRVITLAVPVRTGSVWQPGAHVGGGA